MSKINLQEDMERQEKDAGFGSGSFKIKEGANKIRLLSPPTLHKSEYKGNLNYKYVCYVIDREDGNIKVAFLAKTIIQQIADYQNSEDYGFKDVPMPYDVTISAEGAGTKEVKYNVIPAKEETSLSSDEVQDFSNQKSISEVLERIDKKQGKQEFTDNLDDVNAELG